MYQHADQSWKKQPGLFSSEHQEIFAKRLKEYIIVKELKHILIIFHGGEPLLFGAENLVQFVLLISKQLDALNCRIDFGIQTNGTLLKEEHLDLFSKHNISVSLSIDGPRQTHNLHRLDHKGRPSFDKVYSGLQLLKRYPKVFNGCIAVIEPYSSPRGLIEFFAQNDVSEFDILIPDANYITPPKGRDVQPDLYRDWLIEAFDCWFDEYPHLKCKYFESLLMTILGHPARTESIGLGDISLLVIETDGTYHIHDVLKITEDQGSAIHMNLGQHSFIDAEKAEKIQLHRKLLSKEGLSRTCQACKHVKVCGGGFIAHRFNVNGYENPSIYCRELYSLIEHITDKVTKKLTEAAEKKGQMLLPEFNFQQMTAFYSSHTSHELIEKLEEHRLRKLFSRLHQILPYVNASYPQKADKVLFLQSSKFHDLKIALKEPSVAAWLRAMYGQSTHSPVYNIARNELPADPDYIDELIDHYLSPKQQGFVVQSSDRWISNSLGPNIVVERNAAALKKGQDILDKALAILTTYDASLVEEMLSLSRHIILVKDTQAHPDKDVSFSDEALPGAIFIGVWKSDSLHSPYVVAASLIHEHLHQKLNLLMNRFELFDSVDTQVYSPWPQGLRQPPLALHAVYVFTHVALFWNQMLKQGKEIEIAAEQVHFHLENLDSCIKEIQEKVKFSHTGKLFFKCLLDEYNRLHETALVKCH